MAAPQPRAEASITALRLWRSTNEPAGRLVAMAAPNLTKPTSPARTEDPVSARTNIGTATNEAREPSLESA